MRLVKIPTDLGSMGKADKNGPNQVVKCLNRFYLNESHKKTTFEIEEIKCDSNNLKKTNQAIYDFFKKSNEYFIAIGGDHSITYSIFKAIQKNIRNDAKEDCGLVVFDAHADLMDNFSPPTHEDYLRVLIEEGYLNPKKIIILGLRNIESEELTYIKDKKIRYFDMKKIFLEGVEHITDTITESLRNWKGGFYLSIDIDAIDPVFAPGTGYNEPGGLTSREFIYMIQRIKLLKGIKGIDLVEIAPKHDINNMTSILGAKIIKELF